MEDLPTSSSSQPFHFKTHPKRTHSTDDNSASSTKRPRHSSHRPHRHHHRRRRHDSPTADSDPDPRLDPDTAFRESLFDAMADDEGAAFWEGVYGQPIHTYSPYKKGEQGELERMSDDEYTAYVRGKMWERSHAYIVEERNRRAEQKAKADEEKGRERAERRKWREEWERWSGGGGGGPSGGNADREEKEAWQRIVDNGLGRRKEGEWKRIWLRYLKFWDSLLKETSKPELGPPPASTNLSPSCIPWPTRTGDAKDINPASVEQFFRLAPQADEITGVKVDFLTVLKTERVRWHPDKMQQRFGGAGIDEGTMKAITAVFQIVDRLWGELRGT